MDTILESRLNSCSLGELDFIDPDTIGILFRKLSVNTHLLNDIASILAKEDTKKANFHNYITHLKQRNEFVCRRVVMGRNIFVYQNKDIELVKQKHIEFCNLHGLSVV